MAERRAAGPNGGVPAGARGAKWIPSVDVHEDRAGQSLATRDHAVIRRWAEQRNTTPATTGHFEPGGVARVLRLEFPEYGGRPLTRMSWDDWLRTFDARGLVFLYQEHRKDGGMSSFFRLAPGPRDDGRGEPAPEDARE